MGTFPRNRLIAEMFKEAGIIEKFGSGVRRIIDACRRQGIGKPGFAEVANGFMVTIRPRQQKSLRKTTPLVTPPITPLVTPLVATEEGFAATGTLADKIINLIAKDPRISLSGIAGEIGIRRDTVKEYVARLKKGKKIRRVGRTSAGRWEIGKK